MRRLLTQRSTCTNYSRRSPRLLSSSFSTAEIQKMCALWKTWRVRAPLEPPNTFQPGRGNSIMARPLTASPHFVKFSWWYSKETQNVREKCRTKPQNHRNCSENRFGFTLSFVHVIILKVNEGNKGNLKHTRARNALLHLYQLQWFSDLVVVAAQKCPQRSMLSENKYIIVRHSRCLTFVF